MCDRIPTPVDPAGGHCYGSPTKPCESRGALPTGGRLSNTWTTYPREGDNPGKLGLNPHRSWVLEGPVAEIPKGARGWVCGLSGCSGGNGPTSLRRVRALGGGARRWTLRHESRPYGAQQARNLRNAGNRDEGTPSAYAQRRLFPSLKSSGSKGWVRRVPAAAVIPAARVVATIIGPKASVAGPVNAWVNRLAQPDEFRVDCRARDRRRERVLQG